MVSINAGTPHVNSFHIISDNGVLGCHIIIRRIWRSGPHRPCGCRMLDQPTSTFIIPSREAPTLCHNVMESKQRRNDAMPNRSPRPKSDALQDEVGSARASLLTDVVAGQPKSERIRQTFETSRLLNTNCPGLHISQRYGHYRRVTRGSASYNELPVHS